MRPRKPAPRSRKGVNYHKQAQVQQARRTARRAGAWRRTLRLVRTLALLLAVSGALAMGGWAAYRSFEDNSLLVLRQVDVVGNRAWGKTQILEKAGLELGMKLPMVPVGKAESALRSLPGIGDVRLKRIFPSRIEIAVVEKPAVAMGYAKGWHGLAPDGARLPGQAWGDSDLPVVDGFAGLDSAGRAWLGAFLEGARDTYPSLYGNFSQIAVRNRRDLEIILRDGRQKVLIPMGNKSLNSLEFLRALIHQQGESLEEGKTIDMRVEGYAYVR
jgi:cell division septal protein FtsQ